MFLRCLAMGVLCALHISLFAQTNLFFPSNYLKSYDDWTRSYDGRPGPNYWQNRAAYTIAAEIDPQTRILSGRETVSYFNNSPDTLQFIRFKLQHDRYKKGVQRSFDVAASDVSDEGTRIEMVQYDGQTIPAESMRRSATFLDISLKDKPLAPKSSATFEVVWSYTLPAARGSARECVCDSTTFFVPYFYPQIAVYDDLNGWASHPYTGQQEFYHDFADYDVRITLPPGFQVWATGEWQNAREILQPSYFNRWEKAQTSETVLSIFSEKELQSKGVYKANCTHDLPL